jgi:hypothetical protein
MAFVFIQQMCMILAAYFLNGSPHLVETIAPRQPAVNVMPRRITNEDFFVH